MTTAETKTVPPFASGAGTTHTTQSGTLTDPQRLRIYVPTADAKVVLGLTEEGHQGVMLSMETDVYRESVGGAVSRVMAKGAMVLGVDDRGFVGMRTIVDHGNIYLSATGAADIGSSYQHSARLASIVSTAINLSRALLLWHSKRYVGHDAKLTTVLATGELAIDAIGAVASPVGGGLAGIFNFDLLKSGNVGLFGAQSVRLDSLLSVSTSSAVFNSMSAGLSASVNSLVSAGVNGGATASVTGGYSVSLSAPTVTVMGSVDSKLGSSVGTTTIAAPCIIIGNKTHKGTAATTFTGIVDPTTDVWIRAAEYLEVGVPRGIAPPETPLDYVKDGHLIGHLGAPAGLMVTRMHASLSGSENASVRLGNGVVARSGKSLMRLTAAKMQLGRTLAPDLATDTAIAAARLAYNTAMGEASGLVNQASRVWEKAKAAGAAGAVVTVAQALALAGGAAGAGAGFGAYSGDREGEAGAEAGAGFGATAGAVIGSVGTIIGLGMVAMKVAGQAQKAKQLIAKNAYVTAVNGALTAGATAAVLDPSGPQVIIKNGCVTISCGPNSSIKVTPSGVVIKGLKVDLNDISALPPAAPAVPEVPIPDIPEAAMIVGGPPPSSFLEGLIDAAPF